MAILLDMPRHSTDFRKCLSTAIGILLVEIPDPIVDSCHMASAIKICPLGVHQHGSSAENAFVQAVYTPISTHPLCNHQGGLHERNMPSLPRPITTNILVQHIKSPIGSSLLLYSFHTILPPRVLLAEQSRVNLDLQLSVHIHDVFGRFSSPSAYQRDYSVQSSAWESDEPVLHFGLKCELSIN